MSKNGEDDMSKVLSFPQRRTQSVDVHVLQFLNDKIYGIHEKNISRTSNIGSHETIKESDDGHMGPRLSRSNDRPTRKSRWRSGSVFAPSPICNFGPKGTLKKIENNDQLIVLQDPSTQRLRWISSPENILIIRKPGPSTWKEFRILVPNLLKRRLNVYIEPDDRTQLPFDNDSDLKEHIERCIAFDPEHNLSHIDLTICLGGDGTLLHASSLFQKSCPPILSFSMGSLGFLTPFDFKFHDKIINEVLSGNVAVLLRSRLSCTIIKETSDSPPSQNTSDNSLEINDKDTSNNDDLKNWLALNEIVIDRGPNSYLSNLDLYINDRFITKVQGDGLIMSTPTGSTAYGMAAGASMVHPNVPSIVICPICPHSLSFRPIVVPAGIELVVKVSEDSRLTAWLSVDGRSRLELQTQDSVKITTSIYPVPSICRFDQLGDWFESLADILHWNLRKSQLNLGTDQEIQRDVESQTGEDENKNSSITPTKDALTEIDL